MNDERPIEKLLRRVAKKRRDEAATPAELHPANRRRLQAEVARQFPKPPKREGWWAGLSLLLNRKLAYAVALVAVIGVSALLILPASKEESPVGLMALDSKKPATPELQRAPTPAVMTEPVFERKDQERKLAKEVAIVTTDSLGTRDEPAVLKEKREADGATLGTPPPASSPVARTAPVASRSTSNVELDRAEARQRQVTESVASFNQTYPAETAKAADSSLTLSGAATQTRPAQPSLATSAEATMSSPEAEVVSRRYGLGTTASAAPTTGVAKPAVATNGATAPGGFALGKLNEGANATQAFSQVMADSYATAGAKQADASPVLMNFVVEQNGQQIRVTDSDGSTYSGLVQPAVDDEASRKETLARGGGLEKSVPPRSGFDSSRGNYPQTAAQNTLNTFFRVSGTNRTLNQNVNFAGNFVTLNNQLSNANAQFQFADKAKNAYQLQVSPLQNSGIQGRLQIGAGREVEVNAVPVQK